MPNDVDAPDYRRGPGWHATQARARAEWAQLRELAHTVMCRECRVPTGDPCVVRHPRTGEIVAELKRFPAHPTRINDARKATR